MVVVNAAMYTVHISPLYGKMQTKRKPVSQGKLLKYLINIKFLNKKVHLLAPYNKSVWWDSSVNQFFLIMKKKVCCNDSHTSHSERSHVLFIWHLWIKPSLKLEYSINGSLNKNTGGILCVFLSLCVCVFLCLCGFLYGGVLSKFHRTGTYFKNCHRKLTLPPPPQTTCLRLD